MFMTENFDKAWNILDTLNEESKYDTMLKSAKPVNKTAVEILTSEEFKKLMDVTCEYSPETTDDITYTAKTSDGYFIWAVAKYIGGDRYNWVEKPYRDGTVSIDDIDTKRFSGSWDRTSRYVDHAGIEGRGTVEGTLHQDHYLWNYTWEEQIGFITKRIAEYEEECKKLAVRREEEAAKRRQKAEDERNKRIATLTQKGLKVKSKADLPTPTETADAIHKRMSATEGMLYYDDITVSYAYGRRSWEDGSYEHEGEDEIDWEYTGASDGDLFEIIADYWDEFMPDDLTGDEEDFEDLLWAYMDSKYDELLEVYNDILLDNYRDFAEEDAQEHYDPDYSDY